MASSSSSAAPRQEMISSAVSFLQDPKVASSSVAQRIAFLESKGLTSGEIDEALGRSGVVGGGSSIVHSQQPQQAQYGYQPQRQQQQQQHYGQRGYYPPPPPQQQPSTRDWRDWFIMAVVSGTIGYGVIALARRYLFPHLQPPNQTILESDRDALTAKYDEVAAALAQMDAETRAVKQGLEQQKTSIDAELQQVENALEQLRSGEKARKEDMDRIAREVDAMKREMPRMFESSSASTASTLTELQSELKSLRSLLVSRTAINNNSSSNGGSNGIPASASVPNTSSLAAGVNGSTNSSRPGTGFSSPRTGNSSPPPPPFGVGQSGAKPSIPAWQLAASETENSSKDKADEPQGTSTADGGKEHSSKDGGYEV